MEDGTECRRSTGMTDVVFGCVVHYIHDPKDRNAASLVCKQWYYVDALTRKHITIGLCYTTSPDRVRNRFHYIESLKLKGKPRSAMFNLIPEDWGGYVTPWVKEIAKSFNCLRSLHFRRMIVSDSDLEILVRARGRTLEALKLDKCSGFSTDGLRHIGQSCRNLKILVLEDSQILEKDGEWLHELALNNTDLETLNFYTTDLAKVNFEDLALIARNCHSLVSVKISDGEILDLVDFFRAATALEEFCGGSFNEQPHKYPAISFPDKLCRLGLSYISKNEMPIVFPFASLLKKLDLLYALLDTEDHCTLIRRCPNLEVLETRNVIGDRGLEVIAENCRRLKRLRIEWGADEEGMEDKETRVSQRGLIALAQGCVELEYLAVYVSDITNSALVDIGTYCKNLYDFRLAVLDREESITDSPLDNGVRALLRGCAKLTRFALYLRPGGLTDVGLSYIGEYGHNVCWMLLGRVGESDAGLLALSGGCPRLEKLEMRGCCFSEHAIAVAVTRLASLRYLWIQGYRASSAGRDLLAMARPFWNIELICDGQVDQPAQTVAYYSLVGPRKDLPDTVIPLDPHIRQI